MTDSSNNPLKPSDAPKPGFFKRILTKMDTKMKEKADAQAKSSCCSGDDQGKGGTCC